MFSRNIFDDDSKADISKIGDGNRQSEDVKDLSLMSPGSVKNPLDMEALRKEQLAKFIRSQDIMNDFHRRISFMAPPIDSHSITRPIRDMDSRRRASNLFREEELFGQERPSSSGVQFKETEDGGLLPIFDDDDDEEEEEMEEGEEEYPDIEEKPPTLSDMESWDKPAHDLSEEEKLIRRRHQAKIRARKHRAKLAQEQRIELERRDIEQLRRVQAMPIPVIPKREEEIEFKAVPIEQDIDLGNTYITEPHQNAVSRKMFKERRAACQRNRRAMMTDDNKEKVREQNRLRQQALRDRRRQAALAEAATHPLAQSFMEKKADVANKMRGKRAAMSEEEKKMARERNAQQSRDRRSRESEEQRAFRRERDAAKQRARRHAIYAEETEEQRNERKKAEAERRRRCHRINKGRNLGNSSENTPEPTGSEQNSLAVEYPDEPIISVNDLVLKMTEN